MLCKCQIYDKKLTRIKGKCQMPDIFVDLDIFVVVIIILWGEERESYVA